MSRSHPISVAALACAEWAGFLDDIDEATEVQTSERSAILILVGRVPDLQLSRYR